METASLWVEASTVVSLRMMRLAQGGKLADREAKRMVEEKVAANMMLGWALLPSMLAGASAQQLARHSLGHYGSRVRANKRRLGRAAARR